MSKLENIIFLRKSIESFMWGSCNQKLTEIIADINIIVIYNAIHFTEMVSNVVESFLSKLEILILLRENISLFAHFRL